MQRDGVGSCCQSVIGRDAIVAALIQRGDSDAAVVGDQADQLLSDVFEVVVVLEGAGVGLGRGFGRVAVVAGQQGRFRRT